MAVLSFPQIFGANATQTATNLTINKFDLIKTGLTPLANNPAESLLVALLLQARENFEGAVTTPDGDFLTSPDGAPITYDLSQLYDSININSWKTAFIAGKRRETILVHIFYPASSEYGTLTVP